MIKAEISHASLIPDIDPSGGIHSIDPMIYGGRSQLRRPQTVSVIRKNAGRMPPEKLAEAMGWSLARLHHVARDEHIDLSFPPRDKRKEIEPRGA